MQSCELQRKYKILFEQGMTHISITRTPYRNEFALSAQKSKLNQNGESGQLKVESIKIDINPYFLMITLLFLAMLLSAFYLIHSNAVATKGYQLKRLEITTQELKSQEDLKNMYLAKSESMATIFQDSRLDRMKKPSQLLFIYGDTVIAQVR